MSGVLKEDFEDVIGYKFSNLGSSFRSLVFLFWRIYSSDGGSILQLWIQL